MASFVGMQPGFTVLTGKRGSGKSLTSGLMIVDTICDHLSASKRNIVTNLPGLDRAKIADCLEKRKRPRCWAYQRVFEITHSQAGYFWRYRVSGEKLVAKPMICVKDKHGIGDWQIVDYTGDPGVLYVIDEIADVFSNKHWRESCDELRHYFTLFRRMNDVVVGTCISKEHMNCDLRELLDELCVIINLGRTSMFGLRLGRAFYLRAYTGNPSKGSPVAYQKWFYLPKDVCEIYDTNKGPGVVGGCGDKGQKKKGLPIAILLVIPLAAMAGIIAIPWGAMKYAESKSRVVDQAIDTKLGVVPSKSASTNVVEQVSRPAVVTQFVDRVRTVEARPASKSNVWIVSATTIGGAHTFALSDGRVLVNPKSLWDGSNLRLGNGEIYTVKD